MGMNAFIALRCDEEVKTSIESQAKDRGQSITKFIFGALDTYIPTIPLTERHLLPECPGGYIVVTEDNKLLAMGQTTNLRKCWSEPEQLGKYVALDPHARVGWVLAGPNLAPNEEGPPEDHLKDPDKISYEQLVEMVVELNEKMDAIMGNPHNSAEDRKQELRKIARNSKKAEADPICLGPEQVIGTDGPPTPVSRPDHQNH